MESFSVNDSSHRNWAELPRDLTMSILSRVEDIDVLRSAQFVCSSWLKICRDPLLWRTIQLCGLSSPDFSSDLETICRRAVDYSSGQLVEINIGDFATDRLLQYITNRSSQIKCLRLFRCFQISDGGLSAAAAKLPLLEELELSNGSLTKESLEAVGRQCPDLKLLKFNFQGEGNRNFISRPVTPDEEVVFNEHAIAIAKNFPGLRNLELVGNEMTDVGLQAVLDGCPHLESLDLRCCFNIRMQGNLQKRCEEQIKRLLLPHDGTMRLVEEAHQAWVRASYSHEVGIPVDNNLFDVHSEDDDNMYTRVVYLEDDDDIYTRNMYFEEDDDEYAEDEQEDKSSEDDINEDGEDREGGEYFEDDSSVDAEDDDEDEIYVSDGNEYAKDDNRDEYLEDDESKYSEFEGNTDEFIKGNDNEYSEGDGDGYADGNEDEYYVGNHEENFGPEDHNDEYAINNEYSQFDDDDCFGGFEDDFADLWCGGDSFDDYDFPLDGDYW